MKKNTYEYPPYIYLTQVAEHCPKAVSTYLLLWRNADQEKKLHLYKKDIRNEYLIELNDFKKDLLKLVKEMLISIDETKNMLHIELVSWDEDESEIDSRGYALC